MTNFKIFEILKFMKWLETKEVGFDFFILLFNWLTLKINNMNKIFKKFNTIMINR